MGEMSVYDLNTRETWQELLDEMQSALGMPSALLDSGNVILQSSGERNELCREIRSGKESKPAICGQSQQFMAEMARTKKTVVVDICEAGLAKLVVPVFLDRHYLGSLTACGSMLPEAEAETYLIEKATGIGEATVAQMAQKVPPVQKEQLEKLGEDLLSRLSAP